MEAGKKASASLDVGFFQWRVFISTMQESKQTTETLEHGGTNSAQLRTSTQMGGHSQCATATGNSAWEPSQVLRDASHFKSYLLPVHPIPNCMPK